MAAVPTLSSLVEPVLWEILHNLPPKELGASAGVSRCVKQAAASPLLWFRVYCSAYRGHFTPPPTFHELAAGCLTELEVERFSWSALTRSRVSLVDSKLTTSDRLKGGHLQLQDAPSERQGMIDAMHPGGHAGLRAFFGTQLCAVLQQPLRPLPLSRPLAYVELMVRGGASVGLVDQRDYDSHAHVGWKPESLGYHGDEGSLYYSSGYKSYKFGPSFGLDPELVVTNDVTNAPRRADVIGVGIDFSTDGSHSEATSRAGNGMVFFTKNGALVGSVILPSTRLNLFAFALHRGGDMASLNVGTARFFFDIEAFSQQPWPRESLVLGRSTDFDVGSGESESSDHPDSDPESSDH
jgi:hypothetical protein